MLCNSYFAKLLALVFRHVFNHRFFCCSSIACQWFLVIFWGVHSRGVLVELCRRGLKSSTLFKTWLTLLPCLRFWFWFVSFYVKNQVVFQTNITEVVTLEKSYWYCECKLLIASLYSLSKASSPKRHCSRPLIVKFYTLFNTQNLVFSSPYLACISQIRECSPQPRNKIALSSKYAFSATFKLKWHF